MKNRLGVAAALLAALPLLCAAAPAKEKREGAAVALPVIVGAPADPGRSHTFREGEFWGWQEARYRSARILASDVPVPEVKDGLSAGERLIELRAESSGFTGALFCAAHRNRHSKMPPNLLCLADRNDDGALDQLWRGTAGSLDYLVPHSAIRSLRTIAPVRAAPVEDPEALKLQLGFWVSGTNPVFGTHHFYPMLSRRGAVGFPFTHQRNSVSLKALPATFSVAGAQLRVTAFADKTYRAVVTRPLPAGERFLEAQVPSRTIFISVPG